jgi:hypothetical protein
VGRCGSEVGGWILDLGRRGTEVRGWGLCTARRGNEGKRGKSDLKAGHAGLKPSTFERTGCTFDRTRAGEWCECA